MALHLPAAGVGGIITPRNGRAFELAELQAIVGGYIEAIRVPAGAVGHVPAGETLIAFCNEDGKRLELPINARATALLRPWNDVICGDVVICTLTEAGEGDEEDAI